MTKEKAVKMDEFAFLLINDLVRAYRSDDHDEVMYIKTALNKIRKKLRDNGFEPGVSRRS